MRRCGSIRRSDFWPAPQWRKTNCAAVLFNPMTLYFSPSGPFIATKCGGRQPEKFDPGRFAPENRSKLSKYQYLPFGAGPRVCVGADFAMMQARIILASLIQRFRFTPATPAPRPVMMMTVRPEPGVFLGVMPV